MEQTFSCHCQQGWCDIPGTVEEVKVRLKKRHEGAIKRERKMAYSIFAQVMELRRLNIFVVSFSSVTSETIIKIFVL